MQVEGRPEWLPDVPLSASGRVSRSFRVLGADSYVQAAALVHALPYGRPSRPNVVLVERRGTCSSRHALLAGLAQELGIDVRLVEVEIELGPHFGPGVAALLGAAQLPPLPELHAHLVWRGRGVDLTFPPGSDRGPSRVKGPPREISVSDLPGKAARHRARLRSFAAERGLDPDKVWTAREACIAAMSQAEVEQRVVEAVATRELRRAVLRPHQRVESLSRDDAPGSLYLLREERGAAVATGYVTPQARPNGPEAGWRIRGMATAEHARSQGHGREILRGLMSAAAQGGATEIWCNARIGAEAFYASHGFHRASERFEIPDIGPHYVMARSV